MSQPKLHAAIYARYSSDLQRDASVEDQIRSCTDYAKAQGLEVVATYSDRAISGASLMRSGMQALLRDARGGTFDVVISEALDRLSRNQADIAHIYQEFCFNGLPIETLSEGLISEIHIGLKRTMNALQFKDIAMKTHRALKGRALEGKSAGGKAYGYRMKPQLTSSGEVIRGEREIHPEEADVVRRIFRDYARGLSPKKIAEALNQEGVPAPSGRYWGASTIHGNRQRGTGILNNELYIGRQIWNRLRYVKDPKTGKRISRLNPESYWTVTEVPHLRIVDQDLWEAVRSRQGALKTKGTSTSVWDRRRPKTLFSGLMACGCCGGGFAKISKGQLRMLPGPQQGRRGLQQQAHDQAGRPGSPGAGCSGEPPDGSGCGAGLLRRIHCRAQPAEGRSRREPQGKGTGARPRQTRPPEAGGCDHCGHSRRPGERPDDRARRAAPAAGTGAGAYPCPGHGGVSPIDGGGLPGAGVAADQDPWLRRRHGRSQGGAAGAG
ncbi:recombinase family protein [Ruegeria sp. WL0004]|uniref:Recombinase family protein n=1 Tax=Ruegeria marisflavi TaxID=2984152 RepID=A0ABT2WXD4_9RHOB|nr:recombinase family protein [Ruegeria sp. WL0004]MCU9840571.1 recombinase family protein [Ruegeria sp. WL0004]